VTTNSEPSCAEISLRLIAGAHASDDPALASHVGTCLRCFRTAAEMRELPRLAALLREGDERQSADPGEAFWARFPATVNAAWEKRRARRNPLLEQWRHLTAWLRQPFAAALAGAAVASLVLTLVGRPPPMSESNTRPPVEDEDVTSAEMLATPEVMGEEDAPWEMLELTDGKAAVAQVDQDGNGAGNVAGNVAAPDDGELATPAEELESLDGDELPAVAQAMRGRI
jgi:hypothetical protein